MNFVRKLLCWAIIIYAFIGDFIINVFHIVSIRLIAAAIFAFCAMIYILLYFNKKNIIFLFVGGCLVGLFYLMRGNLTWISAFYTILMAFFLYKEKEYSTKLIDLLFFSQLLLIVIETVMGKYIFLEAVTGLSGNGEVDTNTIENGMEDRGLRPKGFFLGTLIATSFNIYYACINYNDKRKLLWSLLMSLLLLGRLNILVNIVILAYHYKNKIFASSKDRIRIIFALALIGFIFQIAVNNIPSIALKKERMFDTFNLKSDDNAGRIFRYFNAFDTYFQYDLVHKLFGNEHELLDIYGRPVAAESDLAGQLLEIGFIGTSIYLFAILIILFKKDPEGTCKDYKFIALVTLFSYLEYRHTTGNIRAIMFWLLMFYAFNNNNQNIKGSFN